jgi:hypothetical protein
MNFSNGNSFGGSAHNDIGAAGTVRMPVAPHRFGVSPDAMMGYWQPI